MTAENFRRSLAAEIATLGRAGEISALHEELVEAEQALIEAREAFRRAEAIAHDALLRWRNAMSAVYADLRQ